MWLGFIIWKLKKSENFIETKWSRKWLNGSGSASPNTARCAHTTQKTLLIRLNNVSRLSSNTLSVSLSKFSNSLTSSESIGPSKWKKKLSATSLTLKKTLTNRRNRRGSLQWRPNGSPRASRKLSPTRWTTCWRKRTRQWLICRRISFKNNSGLKIQKMDHLRK